MTGAEPLFRQAAIKSKLVSQQDLQAATHAVRTGGSKPSDTVVDISEEKLADQLVKMGRVNRWQAEQLKLGRTRFHLKDYQVFDQLGQGGMGQVFKVWNNMF